MIKRRMFKKFILVVLSVVSVFTLIACNGGGQQQEQQKDGATTITFWGYGEATEIQIFRELVNQFNEDHKGEIYVDYVTKPGNNYYEAVEQIIAGNRCPDVVYVGDDVCKSLAEWTHESIRLEACGFRKYYLSDNTSKRCSFSLLASHLLGRTKKWNPTNINAGGWAESKLNTSLNTRLYNAMPTQIKELLKKVIVYSSIGNMSSELSSSNCYITIPSAIEVDPTMNSEPYNSEGTSISYLSTNESRKRAFDGGDYAEYWLRSPNINYANYIYRVGADGQMQGITNATTNLGVLIEISF